MASDTSPVGKNVAVVDPVRTVRVSDELWEALQEFVMTRRPGESTEDYRDRIKAGPSAVIRELIERHLRENQ